MKVLTIIPALAASSLAMTVQAPHTGTHAPLQQMPMPMTMMMYMNFWDGNEMSFLFAKATSTTTGQFILGLVVVFVGAVLLELLNHFRSVLYRGSIAKLAFEQTQHA